MRQSFLNSPSLFVALFSIIVPGRLVALDLELMRVGDYDTSGSALGVALSGNCAYVADGGRLGTRVEGSASLTTVGHSQARAVVTDDTAATESKKFRE